MINKPENVKLIDTRTTITTNVGILNSLRPFVVCSKDASTY